MSNYIEIEFLKKGRTFPESSGSNQNSDIVNNNKHPAHFPMESSHDQYAYSPYRFINAIIFCMSGLANSLIVQALSPISYQVQKYCGVSELEVNMCALIFMIVHPFMTFVANYILNRWGIKLGCSINSVLVIIGVACRCLVKTSFAFVVLGNTIIAFGNVFILNSPSQFSANWFKPQSRLVVTSLAVFCMSVSGGFGALMSPFIVKTGLSQQYGLDSLFKLMLIQGGPIALIMLINLVFFRGKPDIPPAPSGNKKRYDFWPSLKGLVSNRNYVLLFFSMMCVLGTSNSFAVTIESFVTPFGITSQQSGIGLALTVVTGLTGAVLSSIYIRKTKLYVKTIRYEMLFGILSMVLIVMPLLLHIMPLFWIAVCLLGFFIYPIIPAIIELGCEVVFPISYPISTGFLLAGGQLFGFALGVAQTAIIKGQNKAQSLIGGAVYTVVFIGSLVIFMFVKQDLRRLDYEQYQSVQESIITEQDRSVNY